jgi:hypothetical protein
MKEMTTPPLAGGKEGIDIREMTTAEFAKANLAALEETVTIRRYTQVIGTYYPKGFEPSEVPPAPTLGLDEIAPSSAKATAKILEDLTDEVRRLKKELAARPTITTTAMPESGHETIAVTINPYRPTRSDDPFAALAKQDRDFFERKLGKKK